MVLLLAIGCADIAFTLGGGASEDTPGRPDSGGDDTAAGDTGAADSGPDDTGPDTGGPDGLASVFDVGEVIGAPSVYFADWMAPGDLNGDGLADVVASVFADGSWSPGNLSHDFDLVLSDGSGGYTVTTAHVGLLGDLPIATAVADFDGDGRGDLAAAYTTGVSVFRFDGKTLSRRRDFPVGEAHHVRAGDLDGDGDVDLVSLLVGEALVLLNDGRGRFAEGPRVPTQNTNLNTGSRNVIRLGDFDSDGILDLFTTGDPWYGTPAQVNLGVGDGTFGAAITYFPLMSDARDIAVGDFDGDGANEVAFLDVESATVRVGEWSGTVSSPVDHGAPFDGVSWLGQGDVDGDGDRDVLGFDGYRGAVLLQGPSGLAWQPEFTIVERALVGGPGEEIFVTGDADGDGCDDLFVYDGGDGYRLARSRAAGCVGVRRVDGAPGSGRVAPQGRPARPVRNSG